MFRMRQPFLRLFLVVMFTPELYVTDVVVRLGMKDVVVRLPIMLDVVVVPSPLVSSVVEVEKVE